MTRSTHAETQASADMSDDALSHDLIGSGAWVLPLLIATFLVYREFKKDAGRGRLALGILMAVGTIIILVPKLGTRMIIVPVLSMLALILVILERLL
jgi:hypothetical protein